MTLIDHIFSIVDANLAETHRNLQTPGYCQKCGSALPEERKGLTLCVLCVADLVEADDLEHWLFEREWATNPKYAEDRKRDRTYLEHMDGGC